MGRGQVTGPKGHTHHSRKHTHILIRILRTPFLPPAGVSNLIQQVCRLNKGLRLLNLSKTSLTSKGSSLCALISIPTYSNCVQIVNNWKTADYAFLTAILQILK